MKKEKAKLQPIADMVILGRRRFNARGLTSVVQSAAELKFADEGLMDKIAQNLLTRMDKLDAIEVTDLVYNPSPLASFSGAGGQAPARRCHIKRNSGVQKHSYVSNK